MDRFKATITILASLACAGAAFAAGPAATGSRDVLYGDLDLSTEAGRSKLDERLHTAARRICTKGLDWRDIGGRKAAEDCQRQAVAKAHMKLAPVLSSRLASR